MRTDGATVHRHSDQSLWKFQAARAAAGTASAAGDA
jgi:hypothetical protein